MGALPELFEIQIPVELEVEDSVYAFELQPLSSSPWKVPGHTAGLMIAACAGVGLGGWVGPLFESSTHAFSG